MNPEHYEKVRQVSAACEVILREASARVGAREAMSACGEPCDAVWQRELPSHARLDLSDSDLSGCLFLGGLRSPFEHANFRSARLDGSRWVGVKIDNADFSDASLRDCIMAMVWCQRTKFCGADLSGARLKSPIILGKEWAPDLTGADLSGAIIGIGVFGFYAHLKGARMAGCRVYAGQGRDDKPGDPQRRLDEFLACLSPQQRAEIVIGPEPEEPAGNEEGAPATGSQCFLATAACGSPQARDVVVLREFRDTVLRAVPAGRALVRAYEALSPPVARVVARSPVLRCIVRRLVVVPGAALARRYLRPQPWQRKRTRAPRCRSRGSCPLAAQSLRGGERPHSR